MQSKTKHYLSFFGLPIAIIVLGNITVNLLHGALTVYTFIPGVMVYWAATIAIVCLDAQQRNISIFSYLQGTRVKAYLVVLSLLVGLIPLPIFIHYLKNLNTAFLIITWIAVAVINPFFEEIFWRGYMLEHRAKMPFIAKAFYSTLLFTLSHVFIWGVISKVMLTKELIISVFIMGLAWAFIYHKSRSIVLPYFSHMLVDIFNLSVLAFMNLLPVVM